MARRFGHRGGDVVRRVLPARSRPVAVGGDFVCRNDAEDANGRRQQLGPIGRVLLRYVFGERPAKARDDPVGRGRVRGKPGKRLARVRRDNDPRKAVRHERAAVPKIEREVHRAREELRRQHEVRVQRPDRKRRVLRIARAVFPEPALERRAVRRPRRHRHGRRARRHALRARAVQRPALERRAAQDERLALLGRVRQALLRAARGRAVRACIAGDVRDRDGFSDRQRGAVQRQPAVCRRARRAEAEFRQLVGRRAGDFHDVGRLPQARRAHRRHENPVRARLERHGVEPPAAAVNDRLRRAQDVLRRRAVDAQAVP